MSNIEDAVGAPSPSQGGNGKKATGRLENILCKLRNPELDKDGSAMSDNCVDSSHDFGEMVSSKGGDNRNSHAYSVEKTDNFEVPSVFTNRRSSRKPLKRKATTPLPNYAERDEHPNLFYADMSPLSGNGDVVENYSSRAPSFTDRGTYGYAAKDSSKELRPLVDYSYTADKIKVDPTGDEDQEVSNDGDGCMDEICKAAMVKLLRLPKEPRQLQNTSEDSSNIPYSSQSHSGLGNSTKQERVTELGANESDSETKPDHIPCEQCPNVFATQKDLTRHMEAMHSTKLPKPVDPNALSPCFICGKTFTGSSTLKAHIAKHNIEMASEVKKEAIIDEIPKEHNPITRCNRCRKPFKTEEAYKSHCCKRGVSRPYGCGYCGNSYTELSCINNHLALHKNGLAPELECHECCQKFMYSVELRRHMTIHVKTDTTSQASSRIPSSTCTSSTLSPSSSHRKSKFSVIQNQDESSLKLKISVSRSGCDLNQAGGERKGPGGKKKRSKRNRVKKVACLECGKMFPDASHLDLHMNTHREKQFMCCYCSKKFAFKKSLDSHILTHSNTRPFHCDFCGKDFFRQDSLRKHQNAMHYNIKPYVCETCGRQFADKFELQRHSVSHLAIKPYKCKVCGKSYCDKKRMSEHMWKHEGAMPFCCEICGKEFARKYLFNQHMAHHLGQAKFHCKQCTKGYFRSCDLKAHEATHSGERPFKCTECGMGFVRDSYLRRHMLSHTGEKNHHCDICGKAFSRRNSLRRHLLIHERKPSKVDNDEFAKLNERYSKTSMAIDFGLPLGGALSLADHVPGHTEERDIMKDIQAVIGLSSADVDVLQRKGHGIST